MDDDGAFDDLDKSLVLSARLRQCVVPMAREMRQCGEGLTPTEASVVGAIGTGSASIGEVATRVRLSNAVVSRVAAKLVALGFVARAEDPIDRRVRLLRLTRRGRSWLQQVRRDRDDALAVRLRQLSPADLATLEDGVVVLERLLSSWRGTAPRRRLTGASEAVSSAR